MTHDPTVRLKAIASQGEMRADKILRQSMEGAGWLVYANVSLQSVLQKEEHLSPAAFSMLTHGSFDFVVCDDQDYQPIFALELDGFRHHDSRQVARDLLKNAFSAQAGLPPEEPLPASLITRIVRSRVRENEARARAKAKGK